MSVKLYNTFLLLVALLLFTATPVFAEIAPSPETVQTQQVKKGIEALRAQMKEKRAKIRAEQDKIKAAREKLKPQIESLKADAEKMKALRAQAQQQRDAHTANAQKKAEELKQKHKALLDNTDNVEETNDTP